MFWMSKQSTDTVQRFEVQPLNTQQIFIPPEPHWIRLEPLPHQQAYYLPEFHSIKYNRVSGNYTFSRAHQLDFVEFQKLTLNRMEDKKAAWRIFRNKWDHEGNHFSSPLAYQIRSHVPEYRKEILQRANGDDPELVQKLYLQLPSRMERITDLALQITGSESNRYNQAESIESYLREQFSYTLVPAEDANGMSLEKFLFDVQKGHCEYFSSAMTVMLRSIDIPARVVNGFSAGEFNRFGKFYQVRQSDAHSWVEVYFPGYGWIPFDPTPPRTESRFHLIQTVRQMFDALQSGWVKYVVDYSYKEQQKLFGDLFNPVLISTGFGNFELKTSEWRTGQPQR